MSPTSYQTAPPRGGSLSVRRRERVGNPGSDPPLGKLRYDRKVPGTCVNGPH